MDRQFQQAAHLQALYLLLAHNGALHACHLVGLGLQHIGKRGGVEIHHRLVDPVAQHIDAAPQTNILLERLGVENVAAHHYLLQQRVLLGLILVETVAGHRQTLNKRNNLLGYHALASNGHTRHTLLGQHQLQLGGSLAQALKRLATRLLAVEILHIYLLRQAVQHHQRRNVSLTPLLHIRTFLALERQRTHRYLAAIQEYNRTAQRTELYLFQFNLHNSVS